MKVWPSRISTKECSGQIECLYISIETLAGLTALHKAIHEAVEPQTVE